MLEIMVFRDFLYRAFKRFIVRTVWRSQHSSKDWASKALENYTNKPNMIKFGKDFKPITLQNATKRNTEEPTQGPQKFCSARESMISITLTCQHYRSPVKSKSQRHFVNALEIWIGCMKMLFLWKENISWKENTIRRSRWLTLLHSEWAVSSKMHKWHRREKNCY